jgi:hypothetical protein
MRKIYEKPLAEVEPFASQLMQEVDEPDNSGVTGQIGGKENDDIVDDEEPTSLVEKEVKPLAFHSNNYLKKVWD